MQRAQAAAGSGVRMLGGKRASATRLIAFEWSTKSALYVLCHAWGHAWETARSWCAFIVHLSCSLAGRSTRRRVSLRRALRHAQPSTAAQPPLSSTATHGVQTAPQRPGPPACRAARSPMRGPCL